MTTMPLDRLEPLVASAARGDADAFGQILAATSGMVASIVLAIVRDVDLSHEVDRLELIDEYMFPFIPGSPATARPCTRAVCPRRGGSSGSRRGRSAAVRWRSTTRPAR